MTGIRYAKRGTAPGKAVLVKTKTGIAERELEMYHNPGIASSPTVNDQVIEIPLGNRRIVVASHNYRVEINPGSRGDGCLLDEHRRGYRSGENPLKSRRHNRN